MNRSHLPLFFCLLATLLCAGCAVSSAQPADAPAAGAAKAEPALPAGPVRYTIDPARSSLIAVVLKDPDTAGQALSHDHAVRASNWTGHVVWDPSAPAACAVQFDLPVSGLEPDADATRKAAGLEGSIGDGQRNDIRSNMRAKGQLWMKQYANITFRSTACATDGKTITVTGDFEVRGIKKRVTVPMKVKMENGELSASGRFTVNHTDFGFEPYSALFGALKNVNPIKIRIDVKGKAG